MLITIDIKLALVWHLMMLYMGENVELQYVEMKWKNESLIVRNSLKSQLRRSRLLEKDLKLLKIVKRVMLILDEKKIGRASCRERVCT